MIVAHRGASHEAPENTMPAFKLAWEQNADAIEGDFRLTKDGHIVCIHDGNTKRVANMDVVVNASTLAELRTVDVGLLHGEIFKDVGIPTIAEVFSTIPAEKIIYIEIKCGAEIIPPLLEALQDSSLKNEQVIFICFNAHVLHEVKVQAPQYKGYWLCSFQKTEEGAITPPLESVLETLAFIKADGIDSNASIPDSFIEAIKTNGYEWHVWTVDDLEVAKRIQTLGADSITSNRPGYIKNNLND